jgi:ribosomal protein S18 acetylase RimI-like enzyme
MTEVKDAAETDIDGVADSLVSAFHDDPVMLHMFPNDKGRERKLRALFLSESRRALTRGALHTTAGGTAQGGAIWMAPNKWKTGGVELLGQIPLLIRMGLGSTSRALGVLGKMEKVHPEEPHWYLAVLGTATEHQGKGVGSALIAPVLTKCDAEGIPAYLESSKESNIPFYRRHGFEVTDEISVKNGPTLWPMWRDPRPPDA